MMSVTANTNLTVRLISRTGRFLLFYKGFIDLGCSDPILPKARGNCLLNKRYVRDNRLIVTASPHQRH